MTSCSNKICIQTLGVATLSVSFIATDSGLATGNGTAAGNGIAAGNGTAAGNDIVGTTFSSLLSLISWAGAGSTPTISPGIPPAPTPTPLTPFIVDWSSVAPKIWRTAALKSL